MRYILVSLILTTAIRLYAQTSPSTLFVQGNSQLSAKPTITVVSLSVQTAQPTYASAVEDLINRMDLLTKVLKDLKFNDEEIITSTFMVNKNMVYEQGMRKDKGYIATQNLMVQFPQNKKKLLAVLNKSTQSDANPEISLSFELDAESKAKVKAELIQLAVRDAKMKAELIANEAGYKIIGIEKIEYGKLQGTPREPFMMAKANMLNESVDLNFSNFEAADLSFSDAVEILFLIEEKD